MKYDVIIAGASFAGLAVASRLKGKILLLDQYDIGSHQNSACVTLLRIPRSLGLQDSVLQAHTEGYIHLRNKTIKHLLPQPFCTLDFFRFCQGLLRLSKAEFLKARILGFQDGKVITSKGAFESRCLIDATGWRAMLASSIDNSYVNLSKLSFGLEVEIKRGSAPFKNNFPSPLIKGRGIKGEGSLQTLYNSGIHFWVDREVVPKGYGWLFPCGDYSRAGIGSYKGSRGVNKALGHFIQKLGTRGQGIHGGFFPWGLRSPVIGKIFVVGDAAGQCLPITGEGIRSSIFFGQACGNIVQRIIEGHSSIEQGLEEYTHLVNGFKRGYDFLQKWQLRLSRWPYFLVYLLFLTTAFRPVSHSLLSRYVFLKK